ATTHARYTSTNAPPPFSPARYGNFQTLPRPTAAPVAARTNAARDDQCPWSEVRDMAADSNSPGLHEPLFLPRPVALLHARALVVRLLALREPDLELRAAARPVHVERHDRVALALDRADQAVELVPLQQQLARARRVGVRDLRGRGDRVDARADQ